MSGLLLNLNIGVLKVFFQSYENLEELGLRVFDLGHAKTMDQMADRAPHNFASFAFVKLLIFDLLHKAYHLRTPLRAFR